MSTKVVLAHSLARSMNCSVPFGRFGTADEVAKLLSFSRPTKSSYVTGIELFIDCGFTQI